MHVAAFVVARAKAGVSPSGIAANLSAIRWFHGRLSPARPEVVDPARGVARVLGEVGTIPAVGPGAGVVGRCVGSDGATADEAVACALDPHDAVDLLRIAEAARTDDGADLKSLCDLLMVCVGYAGGLRADDLCRARLEWLERVPSGYVLRPAVSKLNGSGRRPEGVLLAGRDDALDPVAAIDARKARTGLTEGPLLPSLPLREPSRAMATEGVGDRLARLAARTGGAVRPTGHSLRRSWATHAYEAGLDLLSISRQLRHRRVSGTRTYIQSLTPWPDNPGTALGGEEE